MTKTIDYITPMVFPDDQEWRRTHGMAGNDAKTDVRYRTWGTEELLIRLVRRNMPWVRDIIILLAQDSQRQPWMAKYGIKVVYHKEFIPERFLPTLNSRAIEMFLHKIPGLSERFLYGNDDVFPLSLTKEEDFFRDGKPCQLYKERPLPSDRNLFHAACMNGLNFVARDFGRHFTGTWLEGGHSIAAILLDTCRELWSEHGDEIEKSVTKCREVCNFNQYIYGWRQHLAGNYVPSVQKRRNINVKKNTVEEMVQAIRSGGLVCINDNEAVQDITPYATAARREMERRLG